MRSKIILACSKCENRNYTTHKNKLNQSERFETKKYCKRCNAHTVHRETK